MGTGGGGGVEWGTEVLTAALDEGLAIEWVDISEIPDDAWTCTPYGMGSIAPPSPETQAQIEHLGLVDRLGHRAMEAAVRELGEYAGVEIGAIVAAELGAGNTPAPLITGVRLGIPVVDGDYAGRAIPEEMQGTPYLYEKDSFPLASVDRWGNVVILKEACSPHMLERIGKMMAVAAFGTCTIAATLLSGRETKDIIVPGTLTKCLSLGRTIRQARERGDDPVQAAIEHTGGWPPLPGGGDWQGLGGSRGLHDWHHPHQRHRGLRRSHPRCLVREREPRLLAGRGTLRLQPRSGDHRGSGRRARDSPTRSLTLATG